MKQITRMVTAISIGSLVWATPPMAILDLPSQWTNDQNKTVQFKEWKGRLVVMGMAYTSCRGSCPLIVQKMRRIQSLFERHKIIANYVVVSFDPLRDTPAVFTRYRKETGISDPHWSFLSGNETQTRELSMLLGIRYSQDEESGEITHDNKIVLLSAQGKILHTLNDLSQKEEELLNAIH